jgi:hypothetical protein
MRIPLFLIALFLGGTNLFAGARVSLLRVPDSGIQPQAVVDDSGSIHLIYFKGDAGGGDIFYTRLPNGAEKFAPAIRVNRDSDRAIAAGTIRGAQLALGKGGRVHVAWNGRAPDKGDYMQAPMLYTRMNDNGTEFEPARNVITAARGLDGGGSVAADKMGNVFVFWHAPRPGDTNGEAGRAVFVARSTDEGKSFAPEQAASADSGACGCCGMRAFADDKGNLFAIYRSAMEQTNRAEMILMSRDQGVTFDRLYSHPWQINACPMSSAAFAQAKSGVFAAWETQGKPFFARIDSQTMKVSEPLTPPGAPRGKHPVVAVNGAGEFIVAWTEGTGWAKGGSLAWQVYDGSGKPTGEKGKAEGVPVWGLAAAVAKADGNFVIIY